MMCHQTTLGLARCDTAELHLVLSIAPVVERGRSASLRPPDTHATKFLYLEILFVGHCEAGKGGGVMSMLL